MTEPRSIPVCVPLAPEMYQSNRLTAGVMSSQVKTTQEEEERGGEPLKLYLQTGPPTFTSGIILHSNLQLLTRRKF